MNLRMMIAVLVLLCSAQVFAQLDLSAAKADGLVGEDATGYLAAVADRPSADVAKLVAEINEQRRAEYARIAAANGISVADVEKLAARKAINKTAPGQYVRLPGAGWQRK